MIPKLEGSGIEYDDAKWLLQRVEEWDKNILHVAKQRKVKPNMALAIVVGKAMLKRRDGSGILTFN